MMPFVVSGSIHEAESVVEDPPTIEIVKLTGADGTTEQITLIFYFSLANVLTVFVSSCHLRTR